MRNAIISRRSTLTQAVRQTTINRVQYQLKKKQHVNGQAKQRQGWQELLLAEGGIPDTFLILNAVLTGSRSVLNRSTTSLKLAGVTLLSVTPCPRPLLSS